MYNNLYIKMYKFIFVSASTWRLQATISPASTSIIAHTAVHGQPSTGVAQPQLVPGPSI